MSEFQTAHSSRTENQTVGKTLLSNGFFQGSAFFLLLGILLYTFLFSTYPPIHDTVHELRHSLWIIPCH
ncbi:hypothetical protein GCM10011571_20450 [Marinithermofilum abyssi]|uniref:CbtB-domain containing protein n=1 Tax=Marinithermofilum abyssi TaxID=1571185 RepID=A0A8J2VHU4_9BACL|nr:CbtB-domain containing protein [Marinithermofilum abyssi]GGE18479.1 hypothetical protein GCM10011571_20450 [Marinithermofilum abyssi]